MPHNSHSIVNIGRHEEYTRFYATMPLPLMLSYDFRRLRHALLPSPHIMMLLRAFAAADCHAAACCYACHYATLQDFRAAHLLLLRSSLRQMLFFADTCLPPCCQDVI